MRLPATDGSLRWYWVTDVSRGGLAVSFFQPPLPREPYEATLTDVDRAVSYQVRLRVIWHRTGHPCRTGFAFTEPSDDVKAWVERVEGDERGEVPAGARDPERTQGT